MFNYWFKLVPVEQNSALQEAMTGVLSLSIHSQTSAYHQLKNQPLFLGVARGTNVKNRTPGHSGGPNKFIYGQMERPRES